jgi:hypothetical protein
MLISLAVLLVARANAAAAILPDQPVMRLDEIGLYDVGYAYRGQPEQQFPAGWSGFSEETGVWYQDAGVQHGKSAFLLHCPWRNGTGIAFQQFHFALPAASRILVRGATALRQDAIGKSDGVTFRLLVNGRLLLETHRTDADWQPFEYDLTAFAGTAMTLRFETDPGPRNDPSFDFSLWGDRELVLEGYQPPALAHPSPVPLSLEALPSTSSAVAPSGGFAGKTTTQIRDDVAILRYEGPDGELTYRWQRPQDAHDPLFGRIELLAQMRGDQPVRLPLAAAAEAFWTQPAQALSSRWEPAPDGVRCVRTFRVGGETATLMLAGRLAGKSLVLDVDCDQPVLRAVEFGGWGPVLRRRSVPVPYYSGQVDYLPAEDLFTNAFLDWTASSASSHESGPRAVYDPLTDGTRHLLHESALYTASWHLVEVLPNLPNPPSPYRAELGSRLVLDIWGGRFRDIEASLRRWADYGIRDAVVLLHVWQRSGYDNALPALVPANAELGGDADLKALIATGTGLGYRMALHENYVDYYPNYDLFREDDIALDPAGTRVPAWYNPDTKVQSFAEKPTAILRLAATQSPEIHRRYGTNACYLDVHSAVPPWFHVDARAGEPGAGTFRQVWDVHRKLWEYERQTHQGPVFGEGSDHWYWSGYLDGVEAQFGQGWPERAGRQAPLLVDFDLLKVHPLQLNHGMGYFERWSDGEEGGGAPPVVLLDQYRMQEVAFGHAGFPILEGDDPLPRIWLDQYLLTPVTARDATARPVEIQYQVGERWVDSTAAAKAGMWDRVRIRYDSGLTVTANGREAALRAGDLVLPQYGWLAQGAGVTAYTAQRDGVVVDYAETSDSLFANARNLRDWTTPRYARPEVTEFEQVAPRAFRVTYRWRVNRALPQDDICFVHFCSSDQEGAIRFQQDHLLASRPSAWKSGDSVVDGPYRVELPSDLPDGDYPWYIGLYDQVSGQRASLGGPGDGQNRVRLGTLSVRDGGRTLARVPAPVDTSQEARDQEHLNTRGTVMDFGPVRTDGSIALHREGQEWVLHTLPREVPFVVELSLRRFPPPSQIASPGGAAESVAPQLFGDWWSLPLNGARAYRWQ